MLTATSLDADDSLFPIAFAVTQKENTVNWKWFIEWLKKSLHLEDGGRVTIMSDMQKGLMAAVRDVLPEAEQRLCARHIYMNWSKKWKGGELKRTFFACAWSTFEETFKDNLKALGERSLQAAKDLLNYPPQTWSRAYFRTTSKSWIVDNNSSESLNAWVDDFRYLPIIRMIDGIRVKLMAKWAGAEKNVQKWRGNFSPKCVAMYEENMRVSRRCSIYFNGDDGYEVTDGDDRHSVFINNRQCTCRGWDLIGIPCPHAVCALLHAKIDPVTLISRYYHRDTYIASYRTKFQPVRGERFWNIDKYKPLEPPPVVKMPGRPKVKRIRNDEPGKRRKIAPAEQGSREPDSDMPPPLPDKFSKRGSQQKCSICRKEGHNRSKCPDKPTQCEPPQPTQSTQPSQTSQPTDPNQLTQESSTTKKPRGGRAFYRTKRLVGIGLHVDTDSGRTVFNPGMSSQQVVSEGISYQHTADVETRMPIPNEKEMRRIYTRSQATSQEGSRVIKYTGDGKTNPTPSQLPISPPRLMWNGQPAITTSQLLTKRDETLIASTSRKKPPAKRGRH